MCLLGVFYVRYLVGQLWGPREALLALCIICQAPCWAAKGPRKCVLNLQQLFSVILFYGGLFMFCEDTGQKYTRQHNVNSVSHSD